MQPGTSSGAPPPPYERDRSGRSGFRLVLYGLVGLGAAMVLTCAAAVWFLWQHPAVRQTVEAALNAQTAPGAQALRDAGCNEAAVMELGATLEAIAQRAEGDAVPEGAPRLFVSCQRSGVGLDCDRVAEVYLADAGAPEGRLLVQVTEGLRREPVCQVVYGSDGSRLGSLEELAPGGPD